MLPINFWLTDLPINHPQFVIHGLHVALLGVLILILLIVDYGVFSSLTSLTVSDLPLAKSTLYPMTPHTSGPYTHNRAYTKLAVRNLEQNVAIYITLHH